jgi:hypothetical protein
MLLKKINNERDDGRREQGREAVYSWRKNPRGKGRCFKNT